MAANWSNKTVIVTGGSSGVGLAIAKEFATHGANIVIIARNQDQLQQAARQIGSDPSRVQSVAADITNETSFEQAFATIASKNDTIDVLVNAVGRSARSAILDTSPEDFLELLQLNFLATVRCTRLLAPFLLKTRGHVVNIGSLACKSASAFLGAYPASKFPLAAYSQQLRLELGPKGLHVLLVCPGPIDRDDAGKRYDEMAADLPASVRQPGGGLKVKRIDPEWLARRIVLACQRREAELVIPGKARLLFAISQLWPNLADWIVNKKTQGGQNENVSDKLQM